MNAIFRVGGKDSINVATFKVMNEMKLDNLFIISRRDTDLSTIQHKITETYIRSDVLTTEYPSKIGYNTMPPLDKEVLDKFSPYLYAAIRIYDRLLEVTYTFDEQMQEIWKHVAYWNHILDAYKIDFCMLQQIPHEIYEYIIYSLCEIKNIKVGFAYENPLLTHCNPIVKLDDHCPEVRQEYEKLLIEYKDKTLEDIVLQEAYQQAFDIQSGKNDKDKTPYYIKNMKANVSQVNLVDDQFTLKNRIETLLDNFKEHGVVNYIKNVYYPVYAKHKTIQKEIERMNKKVKAYFEHWDVNSEVIEDYSKFKYFYFPLHMQPECTTLPMGGWFAEQLLAVKILSYALPDDIYIFVKEHPEQTMRNRSMSFIDELKSLKNVKLMPRSANTYQLMNDCAGVASITGTALWEGIFKGKAGIMFGNHIKQHAPGIFRVDTNEQCANATQTILKGDVNITLLELKIFMLAMQNKSIQCAMSDDFIATDDEMYTLITGILKRMGVEY